MNCPKCGGATSVIDSRDSVGNTVRRRRQCDSCGERFSTTELDSEVYAALRQTAKLIEGLRTSVVEASDALRDALVPVQAQLLAVAAEAQKILAEAKRQ